MFTSIPKNKFRLLIRLGKFGFTNPIMVDENGVILAGHGRWLAAEELGLETVPVIVLSGLSQADKRTFLLADNKVIEKAGWDRSALALELNSLAPLLIEAGLDISLTGFEPAEIDALSVDPIDLEHDPSDAPPLLAKQAVSRLGDLWLLAPHRLICGDARNGPFSGGSWAAHPPQWCSRTHPLTSQSEQLWDAAASSMVSSRWLRARCPKPNLRIS